MVARGSEVRRVGRPAGVAGRCGVVGVGRWPGSPWRGAARPATGCDVGQTFDGFGWPQGGITPQAHRMYDLWIGSSIAALAVGVFVWGLIFWCVIRYRKRGDELPVQTRYNLPIEFLYTVAPFLIIAVLFYYTAIVQTDVDKTVDEPGRDGRGRRVQVELAVQLPRRHQGAGRPDHRLTRSAPATYIPVLVLPTGETIRFEETARTSSTRSGCRRCCSSGTSSRATCATCSRSPS